MAKRNKPWKVRRILDLNKTGAGAHEEKRRKQNRERKEMEQWFGVGSALEEDWPTDMQFKECLSCSSTHFDFEIDGQKRVMVCVDCKRRHSLT